MCSLSSQGFSAAIFPEVRSAAHADAERAAKSRGYAAGYAEGARRAELELAKNRARLEAEFAAERQSAQHRIERESAVIATVLDALDARLEPVVASAQHSLALAALELAEVVIGVELSDGETSAKSVVQRIMNTVEPAGVTRVRVNPGDLDLIAAHSAPTCSLSFVADASLHRGDAVAELEHGFVDATIGAALQRARLALFAEER